jgi:hypothetical protein
MWWIVGLLLMGVLVVPWHKTTHVTMDPLPRAEKATGWQKTAGKGWQQTHTDRTGSASRLRFKFSTFQADI